MLAQVTASAEVSRNPQQLRSVLMSRFVQVEKEMGSIGFIILYFAAGIFGYVRFSLGTLMSSELERQ